MGPVRGIGCRWGNKPRSLISGFNLPMLEWRVGFVKCTLWLFLLSNSCLLNAKRCFLALTQESKAPCYKSAVGEERLRRRACVFICSYYGPTALNTDRKLSFQKAPWHMLFTHKWPQVIYLFVTAGFCKKRLWAVPVNILILLPAVYRGPVEFSQLQEVRESKSVARFCKGLGGIMVIQVFCGS